MNETLDSGSRAAAYWFEDGLPELVFGAALLLVGGVPLLVPAGWWKVALLWVLIPFLALFIFDRKVIGLLKARITYPRTGYVRPPIEFSDKPTEVTTLFGSSQTWASNVSDFRSRTIWICFLLPLFNHGVDDWWSISLWMLAIAAFVYMLNRRQQPRYSLWAVLPLALSGLPFSWMRLPGEWQEGMEWLLCGVWLLLQGAWKLRGYLQANPEVVL